MIEKTYTCEFTGQEETLTVARGHVVPDAPADWMVVCSHLIAPDVEIVLKVGGKELVIREGKKPKAAEPKKKASGRKKSSKTE